MDYSQSLNLNTAVDNPLFDPKYVDLEYIFNQIYLFFSNFSGHVSTPSTLGTITKIVLASLSIFFIFIITYCIVRLFEIRKREHEHIHHEIQEYKKRHMEEDREKARRSGSSNPRWDAVLQYIFSVNPGDWKLAIIEADTMLDGLMDQLGFKGENLGEKLKSADRDNFRSLSQAWEAHIVRNKIAHEGQLFELSHHEAKRVIALYEQIFREFGYI